MLTVVLSGGPLSGREMDATTWNVGDRKYFMLDDGVTKCTYWRYDEHQAVFEGMGEIQ